MSQSYCSQCSAQIEGDGIRHRGRLFCSDECCEEFEEAFLTHGEPDVVDLESDDDDLDDDDLEFSEDDDFDEDELDDDFDPDDDDRF